ncbi:MAG TPA: YceI family protein [Ktedonobacteraceae bacterium]|nr:YceI family protein [Ktedonobacteraceae bacterium]
MFWEIDTVHSQVSFAIRHMMVSTVRGRFPGVRGLLSLDESNLTASSIEAEVDTASVSTHNEQRDAHLRSADFFDADKYPTITFKSTKVEHVRDQDYKVTGDFTMHGITKSVVFDVEYSGQSTMAGLRVGLTAKTKINRKDFDLSYGSIAEAGQVALGEMVTIEIDLEAAAKVENATA